MVTERQLDLEHRVVVVEKNADKLAREAPRVLIVDDDPALLQALPEALRLRMNGVTVDTADSAAAALERISARDYDAIVADIRMPGMDGLTLLAEILGRRPDTPTLMITGHGEYDLALRSLRGARRSEEHTSELQSPCNLVCRLLLEKKKKLQSPCTLGCRLLLDKRTMSSTDYT